MQTVLASGLHSCVLVCECVHICVCFAVRVCVFMDGLVCVFVYLCYNVCRCIYVHLLVRVYIRVCFVYILLRTYTEGPASDFEVVEAIYLRILCQPRYQIFSSNTVADCMECLFCGIRICGLLDMQHNHSEIFDMLSKNSDTAFLPCCLVEKIFFFFSLSGNEFVSQGE